MIILIIKNKCMNFYKTKTKKKINYEVKILCANMQQQKTTPACISAAF